MLPDVKKYYNNPLIREPFLNVFHYSFCWSSNALEGNTLSLDDTISFLDYDEVRSGHKFSEYEEAKRLHDTIKQYLSFQPRQIDLDWIIDLNHGITGEPRGLRTEDVYIGNQLEAVYYPPSHSRVADLLMIFSQIYNFNPMMWQRFFAKRQRRTLHLRGFIRLKMAMGEREG